MAFLTRWRSPETRLAAALFLVLTAAYAYVFPRWADPNQDSRLKMIVAVVDDGTFQIDKYLGTTVDYAKVRGHYYSDKAPGVAFLGMPVYAVLRHLPGIDALSKRLANSAAFQSTLRAEGSGVNTDKVRFALAQVAVALVVGVWPTALLAVLLYLWITRMLGDRRLGMAGALAYGLLTPVFAYANTLYGHQLAAALLFGAFYWLSLARRPLSPAALLTLGVMLGYAVVTEYPVLLVVGGLYLYAGYRLWRLGQFRSLAWLTASAAVVAAGWMAYNVYIFGGPFNLGYEYSELWQTQHQTGFMSLTLPTLDALAGIPFGLFRGLFVLSPWLLWALPGFWAWWRAKTGRMEWAVAVVSIMAMYWFNASSVMWWGGFAVGPRYILPGLPFLVLGAAYAGPAWGRAAWARALTALLLLWSLIATWGLTLAEQAFPPDNLFNPLVQYAWPNWLAGDVARNLGTVLGLRGPASLLPLIVGLAVALGGLHLWLSAQPAPLKDTL